MPSRKSTKAAEAAAARLPSIPKELIDQFVSGPMSAEAVQDISMAFKKALIERALGAWLMAAQLTLSGCGAVVSLNASQAAFDQINDKRPPKEENDGFLQDAANRFGLMALFAELVYRRDIDERIRDGAGCAYLKAANQEVRMLGMPRALSGVSGWERWAPRETPSAVQPCFDGAGLYYETYVQRNAEGQMTQAVIAFRGTENRRGQTLSDWPTNLAAALGIEPAQYALARERMVPLLEALAADLKANGSSGAIYVTGHSLGGGLAQQAGYLSDLVSAVFAFNTSPVTNWAQLGLRGGGGEAGVSAGLPRDPRG
jgi:hypothetical protein